MPKLLGRHTDEARALVIARLQLTWALTEGSDDSIKAQSMTNVEPPGI